MKVFRWAVVLAIVAAALGLSACGGGGSSSSGGSSGSGESTTANEGGSETSEGGSGGETTVPPPPTTEPEKNPVTVKLSKTPPKGKKVVFMQCELPICALYVGSMEEAAEALGWKLEPLVYPSAEPGKGLTEALQKKPDYIVITGTPLSVIKPQVEEAQAQGVPLISQSEPERPSPEGFASMAAGSEANEGEMLGAWMINDAHGEAHTVGLNLPLYPILGTETKAIEELYEESCPNCSFENLELTPEDIGSGDVPQKVVAYLQAHPETNYVYCTFSDLTNGLSSALKAAGYADKVKILSAAANSTIVKEIPDKIAAAISTPYPWLAWTDIDAAARLSVGDKITKEYEEQVYEIPAWVIDSEESVESLAGSAYEWAGPGGGAFKQEFEELWGVR